MTSCATVSVGSCAWSRLELRGGELTWVVFQIRRRTSPTGRKTPSVCSLRTICNWSGTAESSPLSVCAVLDNATYQSVCAATSASGGCGRPHVVYNNATSKYVLWLNAVKSLDVWWNGCPDVAQTADMQQTQARMATRRLRVTHRRRTSLSPLFTLPLPTCLPLRTATSRSRSSTAAESFCESSPSHSVIGASSNYSASCIVIPRSISQEQDPSGPLSASDFGPST